MITLKPHGENNTGQLIDAVNKARARNEVLRLVRETYRIEDKVVLTEAEKFQSIYIIGEGAGYGHDNLVGTCLDFTAVTEGNCLEINSGRDVLISEMSIVGNDVKVSDGVVVDADGVQKGSSVIRLNGLSVQNFDTNVIVSQGPLSANADRVSITDSNLSKSNIGVSFGQSQARANIITRGHIGQCRTAISGFAHGKQQGTCPKIFGTQFDQMERMFDVPSSYGAPLFVSGVHAERVNGLGRIGQNATSRQPFVFIGCEIDLTATNAPPTDDIYCLESGTMIKFIACDLGEPIKPMKAFAISFDTTTIGPVEVIPVAASPDPCYEFTGFCYPIMDR